MHETHAIVALAEVSARRRRAAQRMTYVRWGNSALHSEGVVCSDCRFSAEASQLEKSRKSRWLAALGRSESRGIHNWTS